MQGDFFQLLKEQGYRFGNPATVNGAGAELTQATTILALRYRDGVLVAGDRRAKLLRAALLHPKALKLRADCASRARAIHAQASVGQVHKFAQR